LPESVLIARFCEESVERLLVGMVENAVDPPKRLRNLLRKIARRSEGKGD
jgi:hypothetical protein